MDQELEEKIIDTLKPTKKCENIILNFNKTFNFLPSNSRIKQNQLTVLKSMGLLYFFSENELYFMNNSNLKLLLEGSLIKEEAILKIVFEENIDKVFIDSNEEYIISVHYREKETLIQLYDIEDIILKQEIMKKEAIVINKTCKDIQMIITDEYLFLDNDKVLSLYNNIGELSYSYEEKCDMFCYNSIGNVTMMIRGKTVYLYKNQKEKCDSVELSKYISEVDKYKVISLYYANGYLMCYLTEDKEESGDLICFLEIDSQSKIVNGFVKSDYFYIEEGRHKSPSTVFYKTIDSTMKIMLAVNKQSYKLENYFVFEKEGDKERFNINYSPLEDDQVITNAPVDENDKEQLNNFIGLDVIDFKFNGYNQPKEMIDSAECDTPILILLLDCKGRLRLFYLVDQKVGEKLQLMPEASPQIFNSDLTSKQPIIDKSKEIIKTAIHPDLHKKKLNDIENFDEIEANNYKEKLNKLRNNFIRKLEYELEIKKEIILDQFNHHSLQSDLKVIKEKMIDVFPHEKQLKELINETKEYIKTKSKIDHSILECKETIENARDSLMTFGEDIKQIENFKNCNAYTSQGMEGKSLKEIIQSQAFQSYYGKNESLSLGQSLLSIEEKINSFSQQLDYNKELVLITQQYNLGLTEAKKAVAVYNKQMLYKSKFNNITSKTEYMEKSHNEIFVLFMKQFEIYLFELKKVLDKLQVKLDEKKRSNQQMITFDKDTKVQLKTFDNIQAINARRLDYGEELTKVLMNTPCTITYANEEGCKGIDELFQDDQEALNNKEKEKTLKTKSQQDNEMMMRINEIEERIRKITEEKERIRIANEEDIKIEESKRKIEEANERKYMELMERINKYEKEKDEKDNDYQNKKEQKKQAKEKERIVKENNERREREKREQEEQKNKSKRSIKYNQNNKPNEFNRSDNKNRQNLLSHININQDKEKENNKPIEPIKEEKDEFKEKVQEQIKEKPQENNNNLSVPAINEPIKPIVQKEIIPDKSNENPPQQPNITGSIFKANDNNDVPLKKEENNVFNGFIIQPPAINKEEKPMNAPEPNDISNKPETNITKAFDMSSLGNLSVQNQNQQQQEKQSNPFATGNFLNNPTVNPNPSLSNQSKPASGLGLFQSNPSQGINSQPTQPQQTNPLNVSNPFGSNNFNNSQSKPLGSLGLFQSNPIQSQSQSKPFDVKQPGNSSTIPFGNNNTIPSNTIPNNTIPSNTMPNNTSSQGSIFSSNTSSVFNTNPITVNTQFPNFGQAPTLGTNNLFNQQLNNKSTFQTMSAFGANNASQSSGFCNLHGNNTFFNPNSQAQNQPQNNNNNNPGSFFSNVNLNQNNNNNAGPSNSKVDNTNYF